MKRWSSSGLVLCIVLAGLLNQDAFYNNRISTFVLHTSAAKIRSEPAPSHSVSSHSNCGDDTEHAICPICQEEMTSDGPVREIDPENRRQAMEQTTLLHKALLQEAKLIASDTDSGAVIKLTCSHLLHQQCALQWELKNCVRYSCVLCRAPLSSTFYTRQSNLMSILGDETFSPVKKLVSLEIDDLFHKLSFMWSKQTGAVPSNRVWADMPYLVGLLEQNNKPSSLQASDSPLFPSPPRTSDKPIELQIPLHKISKLDYLLLLDNFEKLGLRKHHSELDNVQVDGNLGFEDHIIGEPYYSGYDFVIPRSLEPFPFLGNTIVNHDNGGASAPPLNILIYSTLIADTSDLQLDDEVCSSRHIVENSRECGSPVIFTENATPKVMASLILQSPLQFFQSSFESLLPQSLSPTEQLLGRSFERADASDRDPSTAMLKLAEHRNSKAVQYAVESSQAESGTAPKESYTDLQVAENNEDEKQTHWNFVVDPSGGRWVSEGLEMPEKAALRQSSAAESFIFPDRIEQRALSDLLQEAEELTMREADVLRGRKGTLHRTIAKVMSDFDGKQSQGTYKRIDQPWTFSIPGRKVISAGALVPGTQVVTTVLARAFSFCTMNTAPEVLRLKAIAVVLTEGEKSGDAILIHVQPSTFSRRKKGQTQRYVVDSVHLLDRASRDLQILKYPDLLPFEDKRDLSPPSPSSSAIFRGVFRPFSSSRAEVERAESSESIAPEPKVRPKRRQRIFRSRADIKHKLNQPERYFEAGFTTQDISDFMTDWQSELETVSLHNALKSKTYHLFRDMISDISLRMPDIVAVDPDTISYTTIKQRWTARYYVLDDGQAAE